MKKKVFSFILASLLLLVQLPTALAAAPTDPLALDNIYTEASNVILTLLSNRALFLGCQTEKLATFI
mgnify:CR=1 FL=1